MIAATTIAILIIAPMNHDMSFNAAEAPIAAMTAMSISMKRLLSIRINPLYSSFFSANLALSLASSSFMSELSNSANFFSSLSDSSSTIASA